MAGSDSRPKLYIVDSFTDLPFRGNPAGVVLLEEPRDAQWMQALAAELRHAETAFVTARGEREWDLRWFTPAIEVDLCGHATLATAHVLGGDNVFHTRSGELRTTSTADGWIHMDFPADPPAPRQAGEDVAKALPGVEIVAVAQGVSDLMVQVGSAADVHSVCPDMDAVERLGGRGLIVTAHDDAGPADIVSRCFYPAAGVPEDPVTGSAHCTLASWWAPILGRDELLAYQASPRGGTLRVTLKGDRVGLAGRAITMIEGHVSI